jgi:acetate---CoA ligase (ADP-forming)
VSTSARTRTGEAANAAHILDPVLRPRSIAIIGASTDPTKRGNQAVRALVDSGYHGDIFPIHPAGGALYGRQVFASPGELPAAPDLILVCTPAASVPAVLELWARAGTKGAVVLASGFGETGGSGATLEQEILRVARETGIRIVGPNTSGLMNVTLGANLIGIRDVRPGHLALVVQSGNVTLQLVTEATARSSQGFSFCIGAGNNTDIRFSEYIEFLGADPDTHAILMHAEGLRDGRAFIETAARVTPVKPIVLLKGARTAAGGRAARSHTGAIAGSHDVLRAGLRQAGVIEVTRTDELFHVGETLAAQPAIRPGKGIAILSDGGGHAALAMDRFHDHNATMAALTADTSARLRALLGTSAAVENPVDLAGAADRAPLVFARALEILAGDPNVGAILVIGLFGGYAIRFAESLLDAETDAAAQMAGLAREAGVALVVHSLYAHRRTRPLLTLSAAGVPVVESLDVAGSCVMALAERGALLARLAARSAPMPSPPVEAIRELADRVTDQARSERRSALLEPEVRSLLDACGVRFVQAILCTDRDAAVAAAVSFDAPVAVRVISTAAPHKTDVGGVILNVEGGDAAAAAFDRIRNALDDHARARGVSADFRGVLVSPMLGRPLAELILGVVRDPQFGPILTVGAGGTAVEVLHDVAFRLLPVSRDEIREMLDDLRIAPQLHGIRGRPPADIDGIIDCALSLGSALGAGDQIVEMEMNPLFAFADRCIAVDARAFLRRTGP